MMKKSLLVYHPGTDMDTRSDDRMMLRVNFKDVKNNNKQDGGGSPNSQQTIDVVFFQAEDPCEEDPDTDVLAEETVAVESDGDIDELELEELPIDP